MADHETAPTSDVGTCQAVISDDFTSSTSEAANTRHTSTDAGHERLLKHTRSNEGKAIPHCRVSRPPHYLNLSIIVRIMSVLDHVRKT